MRKILLLIGLCLLMAPTAFGAAVIMLNESINQTAEMSGDSWGDTENITIGGFGTITVLNNGSDRLVDITVNFSDGLGNVNSIDQCSSGVTANGKVGIHIPALEAGASIQCTYDLVLADDDQPLNITEAYLYTYAPVVNQNITIEVNFSNNYPSRYDLGNVICVKDINSSYTPRVNYTHVVRGSGVTIGDGGASPVGLNVTVDIPATYDGGNLTNDTEYWVQFNATMPGEADITKPMKLILGNWYCGFVTNATVSGFTVSQVAASGAKIKLEVNKSLSTADGKWHVNATVNNSNADDFYVKSVTVWATIEGSDTPDDTMIAGSYKDDWTDVPMLLDASAVHIWYSTAAVDHSFTYGGIPVIWMNATMNITKYGYGNLTNATNMTIGPGIAGPGNYSYRQFVYVISGYKILIIKDIRNLSTTHVYEVNITMQNLGNVDTPDNVYAYDFVPTSCSAYAIASESPGSIYFNNSYMLKNDQNDVYGHYTDNATTAYEGGGWGWWWQTYPLNATTTDEDEIVWIGYHLTCAGDYHMYRMFIIGVDPIQTEGATGTPRTEIHEVASVVSHEYFLALIAVATLLLAFVLRRTLRR